MKYLFLLYLKLKIAASPTFYVLLFTFYFLTLPAQNVIIKGKVDSSYLSLADTLYAHTYHDFISYEEKELGKCRVDEKGNFSISFSVLEPTYVFLTADNAQAEIICEPGKIYDVTYLPKDSNAMNTLSLSIPVSLEFNNSYETELNYLLADFDSRLETFLQDYRGMIAKKESGIAGKLDTLKKLFQKKYDAYHQSYLSNHIEYRFASLENSLMIKGKEKLYQTYILNRSIQPTNHDYMSFFHELYSPLSDAFMKTAKMQSEVNSKQVFSSVKEYYKKNILLKNDTICEMLVLKSLSEYYRYPDAYKSTAVLSLLEQAKTASILSLHQQAAFYLHKKRLAMSEGSTAPDSRFEDENGNLVSLYDYAGKFIYLSFWTSWSHLSTQDLSLIPDLKKKYGNKVVFISICLDKKKESMNAYLANHPKYDWVFLYCSHYLQAKKEFNVLSVPTYYFLNKNGKVILSPANSPVGIESDFMKIKKKPQ
jgi:thiol-disulfide isomerase/thioredoxin